MASTVSLSKMVILSNIRQIPGVENLATAELVDLPLDEQAQIKERATSIDKYGLLNPLTVKDLGGGKRYRLIAGWRRYMALKFLGKKVADVKSIKGPTDDEPIIQLVENLHRANLDELSIAVALVEIKAKKKLKTQQDVAKFVGKSTSWVNSYFSLAKSDDAIKEALAKKEISFGAARELGRVPKDKQKDALKTAKKEAKQSGKGKVTAKGAKKQAAKQKDKKKKAQLTLPTLEEREKEQKVEVIKDFLAVHYGDTKFDPEVKTTLEAFWDYLFKKNRLYIKDPHSSKVPKPKK